MELGLQPASSVLAEESDYFHDLAMITITAVLFFILSILVEMSCIKLLSPTILEVDVLETWWTIIPGIILVSLVIPSLKLLYLMDELETPDLSIVVVGHQWFWEYNYPEFQVSFESYLLQPGFLEITRLLDVDNRMVAPVNTLLRLMVTSTDVLHAWAMPSCSLKADATPGRINQLMMSCWSSGILFGQCSEICGANHSFMPIVLELTPVNQFVKWISY